MGRNLLSIPSLWEQTDFYTPAITWASGRWRLHKNQRDFYVSHIRLLPSVTVQDGDYIAGTLHAGDGVERLYLFVGSGSVSEYATAGQPRRFRVSAAARMEVRAYGYRFGEDPNSPDDVYSFDGFIVPEDVPPPGNPDGCAKFFSIPNRPATHAAQLRLNGTAHALSLTHLGALGRGRLRLRGAAYTEAAPHPAPLPLHARGHGQLRLRGTAHSLSLADLGALGRGVLRLRQTQQGSAPPEINHGFGSARLYLSGLAFAPAAVHPANHAGMLRVRGAANSESNVGAGRLRMRIFGQGGADNGVGAPRYTGNTQLLLWDMLAFSETTPTQAQALVHDRARLRERSRYPARAHSSLHDGLDMRDDTYALYVALMREGLVLDGSLRLEPLLRLHDHMLLTDEVSTSAEAWARITEALAFAAGLDALQRVDLADKVSLRDTAAYWVQKAAALIDRLILSGAMSTRATVAVLMPDTLVAVDTTATKAEVAARLRDALGLVMHLWLDDGHYTAWTMNTHSRASTRYENYPFNSYMQVGGGYYGVADSGLYRLDGDSDNGAPIAARVRLGMSSLGSRLVKHIPSVYLGYAASGDLLLKVITADHNSGARRADIYRLHARGATSQREGRVQVGRGLNAVYWDFEIENVNGADFDLDVIEFMPLQINRRTRGNAGGR